MGLWFLFHLEESSDHLNVHKKTVRHAWFAVQERRSHVDDIHNPCKFFSLPAIFISQETEVQVLNVKNMFDDFEEII